MSTSSSQRLALLVGINSYAHLPPAEHLKGAINDVEAMADLLEGRFDFPSSGIHLLRDAAATRVAVMAALESLAAEAEPGAVVVFHWSGHGSRIASAATGWDETLVPFDARAQDEQEDSGDIRDKDLMRILALFERRQASLTFIADSCHSGHLHRDPRFGRSRRTRPVAPTEPDVLASPVKPKPSLRDWLSRQINFVLLAACHADQEAFEQNWSQCDAHGRWTLSLLEVLKRIDAPATARQLFKSARMPFLADDNEVQSPQCIGALDRLVFGVDARPAAAFIEVRHCDGRQLLLKGGHAHGLCKGSLWRIYPANTFEPKRENSIASAKIVQVGALSSQASTEIAGRDQSLTRSPRVGDWAYQAAPAYGELRLGVSCLTTGPSSEQRRLEDLIQDSPFLRLVPPETKDCSFVEIGDSQVTLFGEHGLVIERFEFDIDWAVPLLDRLEKRARWRHGLGLKNRDSESRVQAGLEAHLLRLENGVWLRAIPKEDGMPEYFDGEAIAIEISHSLEDELFAYVLDFGSYDEVVQIHPLPGAEELLFFRQKAPPIGTLPGDRLRVELSQGRRQEICFLKVFATTKPTDFDWLRTEVRRPRLQRGPSSLCQLLTMGNAEKPVFRTDGEDWGAVLKAFRLLQRP